MASSKKVHRTERKPVMLPPEPSRILDDAAQRYTKTKVQIVTDLLTWFERQPRAMQLYALGMLGDRAEDVRALIDAIGQGASDLQKRDRGGTGTKTK